MIRCSTSSLRDRLQNNDRDNVPMLIKATTIKMPPSSTLNQRRLVSSTTGSADKGGGLSEKSKLSTDDHAASQTSNPTPRGKGAIDPAGANVIPPPCFSLFSCSRSLILVLSFLFSFLCFSFSLSSSSLEDSSDDHVTF